MMNDDSAARLSKFLSFVLRHKPDAIGLRLDAQGWVSIDELLRKSHAAGRRFSREELLAAVATNAKQRFTLSPDGQSIRAAQGHSVEVQLGLSPQPPPALLYHGTATRLVAAILREGLEPRSRQQVHLSADVVTARAVGQRHGKPIILAVDAPGMHQAGFEFFMADNGVWLTDRVPAPFVTVIAEPGTGAEQPKRSKSGQSSQTCEKR